MKQLILVYLRDKINTIRRCLYIEKVNDIKCYVQFYFKETRNKKEPYVYKVQMKENKNKLSHNIIINLSFQIQDECRSSEGLQSKIFQLFSKEDYVYIKKEKIKEWLSEIENRKND